MRLKEFDLDAPGSQIRQQFREQTRCVTALFERFFEEFETGGEYWKILVEAVEHVERSDVRNALGVLIVQMAFNLEKYIKASNDEKKRMALELLERGISKVVQDRGWDVQSFRKAGDAIREANFRNEWVWNKPKTNLSGTLRAEVSCVHELNEFTAYIIIREPSGIELMREELFVERPNDFIFAHNFGRLEWISEEEVRLSSKDRKRTWSVHVHHR